MAIVELTSAGPENSSFGETGLGGILCLVVDRKMKSRFFRLYDINTSQLIFQSELYVNIAEQYREVRPKFYCYPIQKTIVGFNFANLLDAMCFSNLVQQFSFKGDPKQVTKDEKKCLGLNTGVTKPGFFGMKVYPGWNPVTQTFNLKKMPEQIKTLLRKAGFKKKALKNKATALSIFKNLIMQLDFS